MDINIYPNLLTTQRLSFLKLFRSKMRNIYLHLYRGKAGFKNIYSAILFLVSGVRNNGDFEFEKAIALTLQSNTWVKEKQDCLLKPRRRDCHCG